jgi:hypothetical protein
VRAKIIVNMKSAQQAFGSDASCAEIPPFTRLDDHGQGWRCQQLVDSCRKSFELSEGDSIIIDPLCEANVGEAMPMVNDLSSPASSR